MSEDFEMLQVCAKECTKEGTICTCEEVEPVNAELSTDNYSDDEYPYVEPKDYKHIDAIYAEYNRLRKQPNA